MYTGNINLEVDDYLDLYLVAGKLADQEWQQEIIMKLQNYLDVNVKPINHSIANVPYDDDDDDDFEEQLYLSGWI